VLNEDLVKYIELLCKEHSIPFNGFGEYTIKFLITDGKVQIIKFGGHATIK